MNTSSKAELSVDDATNLQVVIVGGSLAGLMYGLVFARAGHGVTILERSPSHGPDSGQGAGIQFGSQLAEFLAKYDQLEGNGPLGISTEGLHILSPDGKSKRLMNRHVESVNWGGIYSRLRANFDGDLALHGMKCQYITGAEITSVERIEQHWSISWRQASADIASDEETSGLSASLRKTSTAVSREKVLEADLVVAADGANSRTRDHLMHYMRPLRSSILSVSKTSNTNAQPVYAGFVAWRGMIPEKNVSAETLEFFTGRTGTFAHKDGYIIGYPIPSPPTEENTNGTAPGSRLLNFVWYTKKSPDDLKVILSDVHGRLHRRSISAGNLTHEVWQKQLTYALSVFPKYFAELVGAVDMPFVQVVEDLLIPSSIIDAPLLPTIAIIKARSREDVTRSLRGAAIMVGEAYAVMRPNTAQGTNLIARCALSFARVLKGEQNLSEWAKSCDYIIRSHQILAVMMCQFMFRGFLPWVPLVFLRWIWFHFWYRTRAALQRLTKL